MLIIDNLSIWVFPVVWNVGQLLWDWDNEVLIADVCYQQAIEKGIWNEFWGTRNGFSRKLETRIIVYFIRRGFPKGLNEEKVFWGYEKKCPQNWNWRLARLRRSQPVMVEVKIACVHVGGGGGFFVWFFLNFLSKITIDFVTHVSCCAKINGFLITVLMFYVFLLLLLVHVIVTVIR